MGLEFKALGLGFTCRPNYLQFYGLVMAQYNLEQCLMVTVNVRGQDWLAVKDLNLDYHIMGLSQLIRFPYT